MKNTKKLTMGAMLLAIVGAVMVIDRLLAFAFDELIFLLIAEVVIIYATMYSLKDALILSFGAAVITILLGNIYSWVYLPLGLIAGFTYAYGIKKELDRSRLLLMVMAVMVIGEIIVTMLVMPLFGLNVYEEIVMMRNSVAEVFESAGVLGLFEDILNNIMVVAYVLSLIIIGVTEAALIHLLSIYLLKRLKIKDIKIVHLYSLKISVPFTYICMLMTFLFFVAPQFKTHAFIEYTMITLALIGAACLVVVGYIFFIVYGSIVLGKNITLYLILFIILLFPYSLFILLIAGFLYGSGPLKNYIERKRKGA